MTEIKTKKSKSGKASDALPSQKNEAKTPEATKNKNDKEMPTDVIVINDPNLQQQLNRVKLINQVKRREFFENYDKLYGRSSPVDDDDILKNKDKSFNGQFKILNSDDEEELKRKRREQFEAYRMEQLNQVQVYRKRYLILLLFCLYSMINSFQWIEYSSITRVLSLYYQVDNVAINWTSIIYMVVYIPLIIPTSWLMESIGLRNSIIIGSLGTFIGALIKCFSVDQTYFWLTMIGQTFAGVAQLFIISVPPRLAAVWFPDNQVSLATACGVFGNQLGIAIGFVVAPALVYGTDNEQISQGLHLLFNSVAGVSCFVTLLILLFLDERPPKPPGIARLEQMRLYESKQAHDGLEKIVSINPNNEQQQPLNGYIIEQQQPRVGFMRCVCRLFGNCNFMLLFISYGLNVGTFYALSTVLNQILNPHWSDKIYLVGWIGLAIIIAGMIGSIFCGLILDRTHAFKSITVLIYLMSLIGLIAFALVIHNRQWEIEWSLYCVAAFLGFSLTGYLPIGLEFGAEITYPYSESISAGLLNMSAQAFGIGMTFATSYLVDHYTEMHANIFLGSSLLVGLLLSSFMRADMKRQRAIRPTF